MGKDRKVEGHLCTIECPYCQKSIDVIKETEVIQPAVKAEKNITFRAVKALQTSLET